MAQGATVRLPLQQYVQVGPGKTARLADLGRIWVSPAGNGSADKDLSTLVYTAPLDYAGPAAISFAVTDGPSADAPGARSSVLSIPISIASTTVTPPQMTPIQLEVAPGEEPSVVDLTAFTTVLNQQSLTNVQYRLMPVTTTFINVTLSGTKLAVAAKPTALPGQKAQFAVSMSYLTAPLVQGMVEVTVTASRRRLTTLATIDPQVSQQGQAVKVDVLAGAINPVPDIGPLQLLSAAVTPADAASVSLANGQITVQPASPTGPSAMVTYQVNDALSDPARVVAGSFRLDRLAKPDRPSAPSPGTPAGRTLAVSFTSPAANGSPIIDYQLIYDGGSTTCAQSPCLVEVKPGQTYSFKVAARNQVGWSEYSEPSAPMLVDSPPSQPTSPTVVPGDQRIDVNWRPLVDPNSAVNSYIVTLTGGGRSVEQSVTATQVVFDSLVNGVEYAITLRAVNSAGHSSPASTVVTAIPYGNPGAAALTEVTKTGSGVFTVNWKPAVANGDEPEYRLIVNEGSESRLVSRWSNKLTAQFMGAANGHTYTFLVQSRNRTGTLVASRHQLATMWSTPANPMINQVQTTGEPARWDTGVLQVNWTPGETGGLRATHRLRIVGNGVDNQIDATAGANRQFTGLLAGYYTITVTTCLDVAAIVGYQASDEATCATSAGFAAELNTLPSQPIISSLVRSEARQLAVGAVAVEHCGQANGGAAQVRYQVRQDGNDEPWADLSTATGTVPLNSDSAASVRFMAVNSTGSGPVTAWHYFPAWSNPSPTPQPSSTPAEPTGTATPTPSNPSTPAVPSLPQGDSMSQSTNDFASQFNRLLDGIGQVLVGKRPIAALALTALLSRGHLLIEDAPGTGKTLLARALASSIDGPCKRIQFTPDLLPSDVTGVMVLDQTTGQFVFRPGPVFCSVMLGDEINRASPRTQSALLEVMEEGLVTIDGKDYPVPQPFIVIATQNPVEQAGTYRLPEAQLDRFMIKTAIGYPDRPAARQVLAEAAIKDRSARLEPIIDTAGVLALADQADQTTVRQSIADYVLDLCEVTRNDPKTVLGASTRGALALLRCAKVWACAQGRDYVIPDDVKRLALPVLAHRLILDPQAEFDGAHPSQVVERALAQVTPPNQRDAK
jgi:MoxR-like ATPase